MDDLRKLQGDSGFCKVLRRIEQKGMKRRERRELDRRWWKEQSRAVPSSSSVFRYLAAFHDADQEKLRIEGKAFIPAPNEHLRGLVKVNADMVGFMLKSQSSEGGHLGSGCHIGRDGEAGSFI